MQSNFNMESKSNARKERLSKPPRDAETPQKPQLKRGKQWTRENKRDQWESFT